MSRVAVVTDSTCDLPRDLVERLGLRVVPLSVTFGDESFVAGVTLETEEFYARLASAPVPPTTSQPGPAWFDEAYADCLDDGCDRVVSLHCSAALSGTVAAARARAASAPIPVDVVDTRLVGGSLGLVALAAHKVAVAGGSAAEVLAEAERVRRGVCSLIVVDTLDHLRRGGRLSGPQAALGAALRVKPLLRVTEEGGVEVAERIRTWSRALDRVVELAEEAAHGREVDLVVVHGLAPERAADLRSRLVQRLQVRDELEALIGPVVGAHVGPGAVGAAVVPIG